jgi:hypothetical protein
MPPAPPQLLPGHSSELSSSGSRQEAPPPPIPPCPIWQLQICLVLLPKVGLDLGRPQLFLKVAESAQKQERINSMVHCNMNGSIFLVAAQIKK